MAGTTRGHRLIGRDAELARLRRWAQGAAPRAVLVGGEAGVGKSRLLDEASRLAREDGLAVRRARGHQDLGPPPFHLWQQLLRDDDVESPLARLLRGDGRDRAVAFDSVVDRLAASAATTPLLVVIDDAHWADAPSLELVRYLVRELHRTRLVLLVGHRSITGPWAAAWTRVMSDLIREPLVERIDLTGLGRDATRELFASVTAAEPDDPLASRLYHLTRGNPLFVRELARSYADTGRLDPSATLIGVIETRLSQLSEAAGATLGAAAVLGERYSVAVLAAVLDVPATATYPLLDQVRSAGLMEQDEVVGQWRFSHALVREAVVSRTPAAERVALHRRAALALEDLWRSGMVPTAEVAHHHVAGLAGGDGGEAARWAARAGREAMASLAYEDGSRWFEQALDASGSSAGFSDADRAELHLERARASWRTADLSTCWEAAGAATSLAGAAGRVDLVTEAALVFEPMGVLTWDLPLLQRCDDALAKVDTGAPALRARLLARRAETLLYIGEDDEAERAGREAVAVADATGDTVAVVAALRARQLSTSGPEHVAERAKLAERMIAAGLVLRRPDVEQWGRQWRIDTHWERNDVSAVAGDLPRLRWCVEQIGSPSARWHLLVVRAAVEAAQGRFDHAMATSRSAFEVAVRAGIPAALGAYMNLLGVVGHHVGHDVALASTPPDAVGDEPVDEGQLRDAIFAYLGPAVVLAESGRLNEAVKAYQGAGPPERWAPPTYFRVAAWSNGLLAAVAIGWRDDVALLRRRLEAERGRTAVVGAGAAAYGGPVELYLAKAAAFIDDLDAAVEDFETALARSREAGAPGFEAEASIELASVLLRRDRGDDAARAQAVLNDGEAITARLGMVPWTTRAGDLRNVIAAAAHGPLTGRETEVADEVARGLTNRQIADALFISERTAQTHVQHILTKLGFSSRSQIAAWVAAQRTGRSRKP